MLADEPVKSTATESFVRYQPLGPILAVMPWNFPFWQVFRFAAPALMAGNVVLLKHASNVPQCALAIEDVFRRAGFPDGAFQTLLIGSDQVQRVLDDPRVVGASLTGSEDAGRKVAGAAGKQLKKMVLELGGSDPFIVMPSADLAAAIETAVKARVVNSGQSCIAAKRFIVAEAVADAFERGFTAKMRGAQGRRPARSGDRGRSAGDEGRPHGSRRSGAAFGGGRRPRSDRGAAARPSGELLRADGAHRHQAGIARLHRGALRAGGRAVPRA